MKANRASRGFTLIELITVMAITAILMTIITIPVIQSFNLTRAAQGFGEAQSRARVLMTQLEREIGNGAAVRDNTGMNGAIDLVLPGSDGSPVVVRVDKSKIDVIRPAQGEPLRGPSGAFINPDTGMEDPTLAAPKGQVVLPVAQGSTIVRYFIGLRDPLRDTGAPGSPDFIGYNNPHDNLLAARGSGADNLFVLYRAEVTASPRYFEVASDGRLIFDDPAFFTILPGAPDRSGGSLTAAGQAKVERIRNWLRRSSIVTETSRFDMIMPVYDRGARRVRYDGIVPRVISLVQFAPRTVDAESASGLLALRTGEEAFNAEKVGPDRFRTEYGAWSQSLIRVYPSRYPSVFSFAGAQAATPRPAWSGDMLNDPILVARLRRDANGATLGFSQYLHTSAMGDDRWTGTEVFDISTYLGARAANIRFPFSLAVNAANSRSGWYGDMTARRLFVPVVPDAGRGLVTASFDIREVGQTAIAGSDGSPMATTGPAITPGADAGLGAISWADWTHDNPAIGINRRFNRLWADWDNLAPFLPRSQYVRRFLDLRLVPMPDGTPGPLHPTLGFPRAYIVPGSETVIGPDQRPGPNYGNPVRYTRVTQRPVGPNQYFIQYVHQPEPDWAALGISVPADAYNPEVYDSTSFFSAVLQAPFRAGYIEFNSAYGEPLPPGNIQVTYRFQMTEPEDVVSVDYDTTQVIDIVLTIRNYAQTTLPEPQMITVRGSAKVRNFLR